MGGAIERMEVVTLAPAFRLVGWGLVGWYLCDPISERPVGKISQNCAYRFACLAFASFEEAGYHTGPVF